VHSSWFNHTRDLDGIFVPRSCCALVPRRSILGLAINENFCQVAAILYPNSLNDSNFLHTKVTVSSQPLIFKLSVPHTGTGVVKIDPFRF